MKSKDIKYITSSHQTILSLKRGGEYLLIDSLSPPDIMRGFRISRSWFSDYMSIWVSPVESFPLSDVIVFQSHHSLVGEHNEMFYGKDGQDTQSTTTKMKEIVDSNIAHLRDVNCSYSLEFLLSSNRELWLSSALSIAQFGLLLLCNGKIDQATLEISSIIEKINTKHPIYPEVAALYGLLMGKQPYDDYVKSVRTENQNKFSKFFGNE